MESHLKILHDLQKHAIGYPANLGYDYSPLLQNKDIFSVHLNNVGGPGVHTPWKIHTKDSELAVVKFFCGLWKFDPAKMYGYITSSGTEGNMQGLFVAREMFPKGVLYFSADSHYSIRKIAKILRIDTCMIPSTESGEMDYSAFETSIRKHGDLPVIVCANIGTTFKGAIDDTREIYRIIRKLGKHKNFYLHADAALMGFLLPFFEKDLFFKRYIHSISVSGHKFLGVPFPCGIFLMDTAVLPFDAEFIDYVNCTDSTIAGSRSGHSALFMEWIINERSLEGFEKDAAQCIEMADYLVERLSDLGKDAWRNNNSITVVMEKPSAEVCEKWQLACQGNQAHVIVLVHVTKGVIDDFVKDVKNTN